MNKQIIITALLALVAMAGQGQIKCHVEGTLETNAWGDEILICEAGLFHQVQPFLCISGICRLKTVRALKRDRVSST